MNCEGAAKPEDLKYRNDLVAWENNGAKTVLGKPEIINE